MHTIIKKKYIPTKQAQEIEILLPAFRFFGFYIFRFNNEKTVDSITYKEESGSKIDNTLKQYLFDDFLLSVYQEGKPATAANWNQAILRFKGIANSYCNANIEQPRY